MWKTLAFLLAMVSCAADAWEDNWAGGWEADQRLFNPDTGVVTVEGVRLNEKCDYYLQILKGYGVAVFEGDTDHQLVSATGGPGAETTFAGLVLPG